MTNANESELVRRFVEDLTDYAIIVLDVHGNVLTWNAGARALLGHAAHEVIGQPLTDLVPRLDNLTGKSRFSLKEAVQWGRQETTGRLLHKDGTAIGVRIVLRPLSEASRLLGFGVLAHEVDGAALPAEPASADTARVAPLRGGAKILVVDDNTGVLEEAVDLLKNLGYSVVSATNGVEALEALERNRDVDLLFTDVVMPGALAGRDLAQKAMLLCPGLKVLFASGYFEGALVTKGELETNVEFLAKPYRMRELAQKIEEVLRKPG